jgi:hypothetical protein
MKTPEVIVEKIVKPMKIVEQTIVAIWTMGPVEQTIVEQMWIVEQMRIVEQTPKGIMEKIVRPVQIVEQTIVTTWTNGIHNCGNMQTTGECEADSYDPNEDERTNCGADVNCGAPGAMIEVVEQTLLIEI